MSTSFLSLAEDGALLAKIEKVRVLRNDRREGKKVPLSALVRPCVPLGICEVVSRWCDKCNLKKEVFILAHSFRDAVHRGDRNVRQLGTVGPQQADRDEPVYSAHGSFLHSPGPQPMRCCHPLLT